MSWAFPMPSDENSFAFPYAQGKSIGVGPIPERRMFALYLKDGATVTIIGYLREGRVSQARLVDALRDLCRYWESRGANRR